MQIRSHKTHKIKPNENLFEILDKYLPKLQEKSIVVIASKIVGICEGRVVKIDPNDPNQKNELVKQEAEYYLPQKKMGFMLTINRNILVANAGIDESNVDGYFSLWSKNPQESISKIRNYLVKKHKLKNLGIIMTDSKLTPLRLGVTAYSLAHSGFSALKNYVGEPDIFGRKFNTEQLNIADSLATAATLVMGEGNEQQPLAVITDLPFVSFQNRNPTKKELDNLKIKPEDDVFEPILKNAQWKNK